MSDLRSYSPTGRLILRYEYGHDVGNLHVIDYHLWLADLPISRYPEYYRTLRISPADWSRS